MVSSAVESTTHERSIIYWWHDWVWAKAISSSLHSVARETFSSSPSWLGSGFLCSPRLSSKICLFCHASLFVCGAVSEAALVFWRFHLVCLLIELALQCHQTSIASNFSLGGSLSVQICCPKPFGFAESARSGCQSNSGFESHFSFQLYGFEPILGRNLGFRETGV